MPFLIGADPELFVVNPNSNKFLSGYAMIPGTKAAPHKVPNGAVQVDGMALEFNINPARSLQEFCDNVASVRKSLQGMVPGYNLVATPTADFDADYMKSMPEEATELGCEPDFCAWRGGDVNPRPDGSVNFRTGSGHIHIGWTEGADIRSKNHLQDCIDMVKQMDYFLGLYSLLWDKDDRRRTLYGKAGAFRPKPYGVEYRTLSNAWLADERLVGWVYHAAVTGAEALAKGERYFERFGDEAQKIIDNNVTDWPESHDFAVPVPSIPGLNKAA